MKKASQVLLLIGFVLAVLSAVGCFIGAGVLLALTGPETKQALIDGIKNGTIKVEGMTGTPEQIATVIQAGYLAGGLICLFCGIAEVVAAVFAMIARAKNKLGFYITALVLGAVSGGICIILGGIFGIVSVNQENAPANA